MKTSRVCQFAPIAAQKGILEIPRGLCACERTVREYETKKKMLCLNNKLHDVICGQFSTINNTNRKLRLYIKLYGETIMILYMITYTNYII